MRLQRRCRVPAPVNLRRERERGRGALNLVDGELGAVAADPGRLAGAAAAADVADDLVEEAAADPAKAEATAAAGVADEPVEAAAADPVNLEATAAAVDPVGAVGVVLEAEALGALHPQRLRLTSRRV